MINNFLLDIFFKKKIRLIYLMIQILNLGISSYDNKYLVYNLRFIIKNDLFKNILKIEKY